MGSLTAYNGLANATANEEKVPDCVLCQVRFPFLSRAGLAGRPAFSFLRCLFFVRRFAWFAPSITSSYSAAIRGALNALAGRCTSTHSLKAPGFT